MRHSKCLSKNARSNMGIGYVLFRMPKGSRVFLFMISPPYSRSAPIFSTKMRVYRCVHRIYRETRLNFWKDDPWVWPCLIQRVIYHPCQLGVFFFFWGGGLHLDLSHWGRCFLKSSMYHVGIHTVSTTITTFSLPRFDFTFFKEFHSI